MVENEMKRFENLNCAQREKRKKKKKKKTVQIHTRWKNPLQSVTGFGSDSSNASANRLLIHMPNFFSFKTKVIDKYDISHVVDGTDSEIQPRLFALQPIGLSLQSSSWTRSSQYPLFPIHQIESLPCLLPSLQVRLQTWNDRLCTPCSGC